jgi:hypothetical protein
VAEAHACNPSYSGGRDQEDRSLKAAPGSSRQIVRETLSCKKKKKKKIPVIMELQIKTEVRPDKVGTPVITATHEAEIWRIVV